MPEIKDSAEWYVRTGLDRAMTSGLEQLQKFCDTVASEEVPGSLREQLIGAGWWTHQWLREAWEQYDQLPEGLRPVGVGYEERIGELGARLAELNRRSKQ